MNIEHLTNEWIKAEESDRESCGENHWSVDYVIDLHLDEKYDELWLFIKMAYAKDISNKVIEVLAAGPVEDLLTSAGDKYIDEIGLLARQDPKFRDLLGGVWQSSMSNDLWNRFKKIRGKSW